MLPYSAVLDEIKYLRCVSGTWEGYGTLVFWKYCISKKGTLNLIGGLAQANWYLFFFQSLSVRSWMKASQSFSQPFDLWHPTTSLFFTLVSCTFLLRLSLLLDNFNHFSSSLFVTRLTHFILPILYIRQSFLSYFYLFFCLCLLIISKIGLTILFWVFVL